MVGSKVEVEAVVVVVLAKGTSSQNSIPTNTVFDVPSKNMTLSTVGQLPKKGRPQAMEIQVR
jgi:hypothetical protein